MAEQKGRYVRIEGCDGAGKTTQIRLLKEFSEQKGIDTVFLREPGATNFGNHLRSLLLDDRTVQLSSETELMLLTADRRHACDEVILPALEKDQIVVSDRGLESTICYQSAGGGISEEVIMSISTQILPERYICPDALALLSISKARQQERLKARHANASADKMESKEVEYRNRVYEGYQALAQRDYVTVIDGDLPEEAVFERLAPVVFGQYLREHTGMFLPTHTNYAERTAPPASA